MSTGDIKLLQNAVLLGFKQQLEPRGFVADLRQQRFSKKYGKGTLIVHVGFVRHKQDIDVTLDMAVTLGAVEELLRQTEWPSKGSATIGAEIGNVVDGRPHRWSVYGDGDVERVVSEMISEFEKFGTVWLERNSDLQSVFEVLELNDRQSCLLMPLHLNRCVVLVALAKVLRGNEAARLAAEKCERFLHERGDKQIDDFRRYSTQILSL